MFPRDIVLDPVFSKSLDLGTAAHRKHPGITKTKIVPIPTALEEAANVVLESKFTTLLLNLVPRVTHTKT